MEEAREGAVRGGEEVGDKGLKQNAIEFLETLINGIASMAPA